MGTPFLAELKIVSFNFAPKGWALCNGQLLPINQNQALFSLLGTMYGGDGQVNFALPDLRGRVPIHVDGSHIQGERAGAEAVTLNIQQLPQHVHFMQASTVDANQPVVTGNLLGSFNNGYTGAAGLTTIAPGTISNVGGSQAHLNTQPFLVLNYIIALQGIFPSRN
jgi:microcystin-dependent protein